jgi:hypothetical protein
VPSYVQFSMPRGDAERLWELATSSVEFNPWEIQDQRIADRVAAATRGKDLRVKNRYPKVKRPRVELDLRKKAS